MIRPSMVLQGRIAALVRAFGLHQPDRTPCGTPVPASEAHAVGELDRDGPLTQNELGKRLRLEKSTVSRLVTQLISRGWVRRTEREGDARPVWLELTLDGSRAAGEWAVGRGRGVSARWLPRLTTPLAGQTFRVGTAAGARLSAAGELLVVAGACRQPADWPRAAPVMHAHLGDVGRQHGAGRNQDFTALRPLLDPGHPLVRFGPRRPRGWYVRTTDPADLLTRLHHCCTPDGTRQACAGPNRH